MLFVYDPREGLWNIKIGKFLDKRWILFFENVPIQKEKSAEI